MMTKVYGHYLICKYNSGCLLFWTTHKLTNDKNTRSSHQRCSVKKGFLQISQNSQENTCVGISFLINFIKKETPTQMFSCEFAKFLSTRFFTEHLRWLLLKHLKFKGNFYFKSLPKIFIPTPLIPNVDIFTLCSDKSRFFSRLTFLVEILKRLRWQGIL